MSIVPVVFAMFVKATPENRKRSLEEWAQLAKIKNPTRIPESMWHSGFTHGDVTLDNLYGEWSVADISCQCCLEDYGDYFCFELFTDWGSVFEYGLPELTGTPEEQTAQMTQEYSFYHDPRVKIAEDFAQACIALGAEVGLYTKTYMYKPYYSDIQEWLKEEVYEKFIRTPDVRALMHTSWKVLYLNQNWHQTLMRVYPDVSTDEFLWLFDPPLPGTDYHGGLLFKEADSFRF